MTIKIALTNLGKYNEGELVFTWLDLPATDEEIEQAFEDIEVADGTEYEEHFISDYEAPAGIEIGEYTSLETLNELAEILEGLDTLEPIADDNYDVHDVIAFARELEDNGIIDEADYFIGDWISDEQLDEITKERVESGGWQGVAIFLDGITMINEDYYYMNGYANMEDLTWDRIESVAKDLMQAVRDYV